MTWERKITLGNVIEIGTILVAVIMFFSALKSDVKAVDQSTVEIRKDVARIEANQSQFVTKDVYIELKEQMADIKKSLEQVNNKLDRTNR